MLTFFLLCVALVAVCHLALQSVHRLSLWCFSVCWVSVMGITAKPKPPVPPKPVIKSPPKSTSQTVSSSVPSSSVGQTDTSNVSTIQNHATTSRSFSPAPHVNHPEPKKPSTASKPDKHIVRVESVESADETCCSNLAFYICHKGPKNVARQVTNKPKPPVKPPKPTFESLQRARAARRSFGDEIPVGKEGFKFVDDTSTESSADYKDIVFDEVSPKSVKDPESSQTAGDVNLADWEPLETSSRQSDHADVFTDDVVFPLDPVVEAKVVHFSPTDDLNATFEPVEAINYAVKDPITSSKNPVSVRNSWPRRNKKKKSPPKRPPPPKYYHRVHVYYSLSDDEKNRVELSPDASPILPRSTVSNADLSSPSKGNHILTADGRYYCAGDKLSFYPYASSVESHFMKAEVTPKTDSNTVYGNEQETALGTSQNGVQTSLQDAILSLEESTNFNPNKHPASLSHTDINKSTLPCLDGKEVLHPKISIRKHKSPDSLSRKGTSESKLPHLDEKEILNQKKSGSYQNLKGDKSEIFTSNVPMQNEISRMQAEYLKPSEGNISSWPRRKKQATPVRPPPPAFQKVGLTSSYSDDDHTSTIGTLVKPPRPPPPQNISPTSTLSPDAPPRTKRKRSRTVEITPSTFFQTETTRQRSFSLHDNPLTRVEVGKTSLGDRKSLYTAINKDPDRKKKAPLAEPLVSDRMRCRPLPAPPPPPRKISKGKLDSLSSPPSDSESTDNVASEEKFDKTKMVQGTNSCASSTGDDPAKQCAKFGSIIRQKPEKPPTSLEMAQYRSEILQRYTQKHLNPSENKRENNSGLNQTPDKIAEGDTSNAKDKVQLERYETVHNLYKELSDKRSCSEANLRDNDDGNRLCDHSAIDAQSRDVKNDKETDLEQRNDFLNNNHHGCLKTEMNRNSNVNINPTIEGVQDFHTVDNIKTCTEPLKVDVGSHKSKKADDVVKQSEKIGSPRLLRREEILSSYGVLVKKETIPQQTIGEILASNKQDLTREDSINQLVHSAAGDDAFVNKSVGEILANHKQDFPRQESTQSAGDDGDEKEVFAIEVFVSSDAYSTKENSRDTSMEVQSLDNSYCADENANTQESSKENRVSVQESSHGNKLSSPKGSSKKSKPKAKRASQSTFYCTANSEDRSRSSSPNHMQTTGDDSEVSGNIADVDSSAGSSGRDSAEREEGKRRSSTFYTDSPPVKLEKSVQTLPTLDVSTVNPPVEYEKSEDTDELMDIARDIKKELSLIIERHRKVQDESDSGPKLGMQLLTRRAVSSTQSSASEISCQDSSAESEDENESVEEKKAKKLFYIAREIMTSEETFVNALKLLNEDFRQIVEDANKEKGLSIVPDDVLNTIFRFLPQLQNLNQSLLEEIKERIDGWQQSPKIADVLVKVGPFLKLYSCYIRDFETMTTCLDEACRKYPLFGQVVKDFEAQPRCHKLALKHYLLKPVQRIPQYRLLLQDYLNHLSPESLDFEDTTRALQIVSEVAYHANETMKQGDNFLKLMSIQNSLLTSHEIIKVGRVFLKEGELLKLSRKGNQPRWFILFNDSLLYLTPVQQGIFRVNHELPLTGMRVSVPMQNDYQNEFSVISVTRSFSLAARTPEDREEWITALTRAIEENAVKRSSFINMQMQWKGSTSYEQSDFILGKQAPVWIPDSRVTMCQLCTTEFTITYRRHHCRACGRVICSQCSANRAFLKYLDRRSARVCDNCFLKLQEEEEASKHKLQLSESESEPTPSIGRTPHGKQKRPRRYLPSVLKEVCANDQGSTISGYLYRLTKKRWKRYWFVLKDKVLYTYKASEDVAAKESIPVLGYTVETFTEPIENVDPKLVFQLHHPNQPFVFYAETVGNAERWVKAMKEATVLE